MAIKFSHEYIKMPENIFSKTMMILEVFIVESIKELSPAFIKYDTEYWEYNYFSQQLEAKYYTLPTGKLIVLLLNVPNSFGNSYLFTTIRRWTPEKETHYRGLRGKEITAIKIEEK